ncbi:hypothetical protein Celaphus_00011828, partial [Cervus elaphus hippelaphus]
MISFQPALSNRHFSGQLAQAPQDQEQESPTIGSRNDYVLDSKELNFHLRKIKAWKGKQILLPHTLARVIK